MQDLIDLDVATHDPSVSPQLRRRLTLMSQRREQEVPGVPVSFGILGRAMGSIDPFGPHRALLVARPFRRPQEEVREILEVFQTHNYPLTDLIDRFGRLGQEPMRR